MRRHIFNQAREVYVAIQMVPNRKIQETYYISNVAEPDTQQTGKFKPSPH
jgi:hypothetical protein